MPGLRSTILKTYPPLIDALAIAKLFARRPTGSFDCPCCGFHGAFRLYGVPIRVNARCPNCSSLERHRLMTLLFDRRPELLHGDILHFAPEPCIEDIVRSNARSYVGCDYEPKAGETKVDIQQMQFADGSFDTIVCSNVLEHVDDSRALPELRRILRPGGVLLLMFPVIEGWDTTYENPAVSDAHDRLLHFGQEDHMRYYGHDVRDRISAAGFHIEEVTAAEPDVSRYGLLRGEKIFLCS